MPNISNVVAIFFLLNSFGTLPLFLALTKDENFRKKASIVFVYLPGRRIDVIFWPDVISI
jgi:small neutral amino acid transporter SnatA (MarC family)